MATTRSVCSVRVPCALGAKASTDIILAWAWRHRAHCVNCGQQREGFSGAYSVSKAGVLMLSRQLAVEWGPRGVRSNVMSPGLVRTPMSESFYRAPGVAERRSAAIPVGRIGTPEDMAEVVLFLASDRAGFVNGQEIIVDSGFEHMLMSLVPRPGFERGN